MIINTPDTLIQKYTQHFNREEIIENFNLEDQVDDLIWDHLVDNVNDILEFFFEGFELNLFSGEKLEKEELTLVVIEPSGTKFFNHPKLLTELLFIYLGYFEYLFKVGEGSLTQEQAFMSPTGPTVLERDSIFLVPSQLVRHFNLKGEDRDFVRLVCDHFVNDHEEFLKEVYGYEPTN